LGWGKVSPSQQNRNISGGTSYFEWAERVGKYMIRPLLSLDRLSFLEPEGKIGYRWGWGGAEQERMDYLEFIARARRTVCYN
jgi:hypothetical protein